MIETQVQRVKEEHRLENSKLGLSTCDHLVHNEGNSLISSGVDAVDTAGLL